MYADAGGTADTHDDALNDADAAAPTSDGELVRAARGGDRSARHALCARYLAALRSWARIWLPRTGSGINDADDLVQIALLRALNRLDDFEIRSDAGFLGYLRQILLNEVRGELRRQRRRGETVELDDALALEGDPVIEQAQQLERECAFAHALRGLNPRQQRHVTLRVQFGMSFDEIAACAGGNADSARMIVTRAVRAMTQHIAAAAA